MAVGQDKRDLDNQGTFVPGPPSLHVYLSVCCCKCSHTWAAGSATELWPDPAGPFLWVSLASQVWYREEVSHPNPEGSSWSLVDTPGEAVQISCGPHDLLWVTLWEGQALVREGINRNNPKGG